MLKYLRLLLIIALSITSCQHGSLTSEEALFLKAAENGRLANEAFKHSHHFVKGWLAHTDSATGLIPRNLSKDKDIWNANDSAADNYPFMVLTTAFTDQSLFNTRMKEILQTEKRLTSRLDRLPDTYSFSKQTFQFELPELDRIIFGASEYAKDGLLPLTEWFGPSPWSERLLGLVDDIWLHAPYQTQFGKIPAQDHEVNGEMLQVLSRLYWMTGNQNYLAYAFRLADYFLLEKNLASADIRLRLRDHGCEIVSGLVEVYVAAHFAAPEKQKTYQPHLHKLFDLILEKGRNSDGLLYNWVNLQTGEHDSSLCDTWGYNYNGFYTIYLIDGVKQYQEATQKVLLNLYDKYHNYRWEGSSMDGYADAIESALNLYQREPVESAAKWIDSEIQVMWQKQQPDGVIEGWHGDGNFARTSIMYALWKTKGLTISNWREDVQFGAEISGDELYITLSAGADWQGNLIFDIPRHKIYLNLPLDYPRINQFPEWFTVSADKNYYLYDVESKVKQKYTGSELSRGILIKLKGGNEKQLILIDEL